MRLPIKLVCKKNKVRKEGTSLIFVQYCHSAEQRVLVSTDIAIPPEYWNRKTGRVSTSLPTRYGNVAIISDQLKGKVRRAEDLVSHAIWKGDTCPLDFLKTHFRFNNVDLHQYQPNDNKRVLDVFYQIDDYIKDKEHQVKNAPLM